MQIINHYKKYVILTSAFLVLISFIYWYFNDNHKENMLNTYADEVSTENLASNCESKTFFVDIKGAVKKPGVYEFKDGDIIMDAIEKAGGLTKNAVTSNINLSQKLKSEMVIYIFTKNELTTKKVSQTSNDSETQTTTKTTLSDNECHCETIEVNNCIDNKEPVLDNNETDLISSSSKVNINKATVSELMTLSGIGEAKAEAIISYRNKNGNFNTIDDIKNVSGLGDAIFNKIKDNITV